MSPYFPEHTPTRKRLPVAHDRSSYQKREKGGFNSQVLKLALIGGPRTRTTSKCPNVGKRNDIAAFSTGTRDRFRARDEQAAAATLRRQSCVAWAPVRTLYNSYRSCRALVRSGKTLRR